MPQSVVMELWLRSFAERICCRTWRRSTLIDQDKAVCKAEIIQPFEKTINSAPVGLATRVSRDRAVKAAPGLGTPLVNLFMR